VQGILKLHEMDLERLERIRLSSWFCLDTQLFLDTLDEELDPSHQDELRKLREDTSFLVDINSKSNEQKVRSIAGEELWTQMEAKVEDKIEEDTELKNKMEKEGEYPTYKFGAPKRKSAMGNVKNTLGLERKTKIKNKSDQEINLIISYQQMAVTVRTKVEAGVSVPYTSIEASAGREQEIQKGGHPHQEAVVLPNCHEVFELPWSGYYLTISTLQMDGTCVIHEKNRLVRSSQNWEFVQSDLRKQVEIIQRPPNIIPTPGEKKEKWKWWS
jgi:hypothetical protein